MDTVKKTGLAAKDAMRIINAGGSAQNANHAFAVIAGHGLAYRNRVDLISMLKTYIRIADRG